MLLVTGDGNCLLHAVSLYLWGIHDDPLFLRGLVHQALLEDVRQDLRQRWKREKLYWNSTIPEGGLELDADVSDFYFIYTAAYQSPYIYQITNHLSFPSRHPGSPNSPLGSP